MGQSDSKFDESDAKVGPAWSHPLLRTTRSQVLSQMLFVQWLEGFLAHARLALPPADFVVALRRHEWLLQAMFAVASGEDSAFNAVMDGAVIGPVPAWIDEELRMKARACARYGPRRCFALGQQVRRMWPVWELAVRGWRRRSRPLLVGL